MKFSFAFSALLALAPLDAVVGSKCCWPNPPPSPDALPPDALIAGLCDNFIDAGLIGPILEPILEQLADQVNLLCLDPPFPIQECERRRVLKEGEDISNTFEVEVTNVYRRDKQAINNRHRQLLDFEKILQLGAGIGQAAIQKQCYLPFPPTEIDGSIVAFDKPACDAFNTSPLGPGDCAPGCECQDNYCISKDDVCRELMEGIVIDINVLGLTTSLDLQGIQCADPSMGDCCVLLDFESDPFAHFLAITFINGFLGTTFEQAQQFTALFGGTLPVAFRPLYLAIQGFFREGFSTLEIDVPPDTPGLITGSVNFRGDQIFAELCPFVLGDYCEERDGSTAGDPHVQTWNGQWFDFHGECDLMFLDAPDFGRGLGAQIQIRTTKRYEYSYISEAAVKIGNDILTVASHGSYSFNGVDQAELPEKVAGRYPISRSQERETESKIVIEIDHQERIVLSTFKDLVAVKLFNATGANYETSTGLMGDYEHGALKGRDGATIYEDMNAFGQEWQVRDTETSLFETTRAPQYPQKCIMPDTTLSAKAESRRRLGSSIAEEKAEKVCGHIADKDIRKNCIFDVMATGDVGIAGTY